MALALAFFFFLATALLAHNAFAHPHKPGDFPAVFTYADPAKWGSVDPQYKLCSSGKQQSPINIVTKDAVSQKTLRPLKLDYEIQNVTLMTNSLAVQLSIKGKTGLIMNGEVYRLSTIRWHTPSEHHIDGVQYAAEMHQIYAAKDETLAIVATLYKEGAPDPIIAAIQPELDELGKESTGDDNFQKAVIVPGNKFQTNMLKNIPLDKYITYKGSLTTPPCTENAKWLIIPTVQTMSKAQIESLSAPLGKSNKKNARPVKPINGRELGKFPN